MLVKDFAKALDELIAEVDDLEKVAPAQRDPAKIRAKFAEFLRLTLTDILVANDEDARTEIAELHRLGAHRTRLSRLFNEANAAKGAV